MKMGFFSALYGTCFPPSKKAHLQDDPNVYDSDDIYGSKSEKKKYIKKFQTPIKKSWSLR